MSDNPILDLEREPPSPPTTGYSAPRPRLSRPPRARARP